MKTEKITFGQTYIKPSLGKYMKPANVNKIPYIFGLGEFYPTDIFLGSNAKGDLTLDIMHSTTSKYLFFKEDFQKTFENVAMLNFMHNMERAQRVRNGIITPIYKTVVKDIDKLSIKDLQLIVNDKIRYYYETFGKKFFN